MVPHPIFTATSPIPIDSRPLFKGRACWPQRAVRFSWQAMSRRDY